MPHGSACSRRPPLAKRHPDIRQTLDVDQTSMAPSCCMRPRHAGFDKTIYKRRNEVERTINELKNSRATATRFDKRAYFESGFQSWTRSPSSTSSRNSPITQAEERSTPSRTKPLRSAERSIAALSDSVSICSRCKPRTTKP